jgi:hypothetical protein
VKFEDILVTSSRLYHLHDRDGIKVDLALHHYHSQNDGVEEHSNWFHSSLQRKISGNACRLGEPFDGAKL